ncbi:MAG: hypothetical protein AAGJ28_16055 [Pseudomonadota bacterium]
MRPRNFRALALALPQPERAGRMGRVELRECKKVFASMDAETGTRTLDADQQALMIDLPGNPVLLASWGWGAKRWTGLHPSRRDAKATNPSMRPAWTNVAPEALLKAAA